MIDESLATKEFFPIWKKYRPVVLKLLVDSLGGETQSYKLSKHEFTDANTRKSSTFAFKLETHKSRVLKPAKASVVAADLLIMLKQSAKAQELLQTHILYFVMDSQFNFSVTATPVDVPEEPKNDDAEADA